MTYGPSISAIFKSTLLSNESSPCYSPYQANDNSMKNEVRNLNLEREALLNTVSKLRTLVPPHVLQEAGINFTAPIFEQNSKKTSFNGSNKTGNAGPIGLAELKRLNKMEREGCIDEEEDEEDTDEEVDRRIEESKGATTTSSQRSSDSSTSNISSDMDSPLCKR